MRTLALGVVIGLGLAVGAGAAQAGPLDDLRLVTDPAEIGVRLPVWARGSLGGLFRPYFSAGLPVEGDRPVEGMPLALRQEPPTLDDTARVTLGAGVGVRILEGVNLFGEYRFLRVRPDPLRLDAGPDRTSPARDAGSLELKGGLSISF